MCAEGWSVLRFWSHEALKETQSICETIFAALDGRLQDEMVAVDVRFLLRRKEELRKGD